MNKKLIESLQEQSKGIKEIQEQFSKIHENLPKMPKIEIPNLPNVDIPKVGE